MFLDKPTLSPWPFQKRDHCLGFPIYGFTCLDLSVIFHRKDEIFSLNPQTGVGHYEGPPFCGSQDQDLEFPL